MRSFVARAGLYAAMLAMSPVALPAQADAVYVGGSIITMDDRRPVAEAVAMTLWAAYQHFEEKTKGSIEVGKLADFAILSDNPLAIDPAKIADIKVLETIKKGKSIYLSDPTRVRGDSALCIESPRCYERFVAFRSHSPFTERFGVPPHRH